MLDVNGALTRRIFSLHFIYLFGRQERKKDGGRKTEREKEETEKKSENKLPSVESLLQMPVTASAGPR